MLPIDKSEAVPTRETKRAKIDRLPNHDQIAALAYEIFAERGATQGHDLDDWLQAELELAAK